MKLTTTKHIESTISDYTASVTSFLVPNENNAGITILNKRIYAAYK